jgi:hypothetical protein
MNAGRDVERVIASWLIDEAAGPSPDRLLESTRRAVYRTNQRRFAAIWREPMFSPARIGAIAAMLVIALAAGFWIGNVTKSSGVGTPNASAAPTASATGATLEAYRTARNAVCAKYGPIINPLKPVLDGLYDEALPAAERAVKVQTLTDIGHQIGLMTDELEALEPPASASADHVTQIANLRQTVQLIVQSASSTAAGNLIGGEALDKATDPLSRAIEAFESKYSLSSCP